NRLLGSVADKGTGVDNHRVACLGKGVARSFQPLGDILGFHEVFGTTEADNLKFHLDPSMHSRNIFTSSPSPDPLSFTLPPHSSDWTLHRALQQHTLTCAAYRPHTGTSPFNADLVAQKKIILQRIRGCVTFLGFRNLPRRL